MLWIYCGGTFAGYLDKVTCYACGVAFHDWRVDADVWTHHASASPKCHHVVQEKNSDFIQKAAQTKVTYLISLLSVLWYVLLTTKNI